MAAAVAQRTWRDSKPEAVEADLAALWRDLAREGSVARAVMSNLIVFRLYQPASSSRTKAGTSAKTSVDRAVPGTDLLEAVVARHPSRAIVIEHVPDGHGPGAPVGAGVGVWVFGPPTARYGVESVVIRSACAEASLPSIVRRFVRGDLPTSIWWTEDLSSAPPLDALVTLARQLVYDSRGWRDFRAGVRTVATLAANGVIDLADLNWRRLATLRQALVHAAAAAEPCDVTADMVRIRYRPGEATLAWLLAGWVAAKLEWPDTAWPEIAGADVGDEILTMTVGDDALAVELNEHRVHVATARRPPFEVTARPESEADAIAAELKTLSAETELNAALRALARNPQRG
jgi:glucose-6-phosphate dehydrogenase assembly protein OpcA